MKLAPVLGLLALASVAEIVSSRDTTNLPEPAKVSPLRVEPKLAPPILEAPKQAEPILLRETVIKVRALPRRRPEFKREPEKLAWTCTGWQDSMVGGGYRACEWK